MLLFILLLCGFAAADEANKGYYAKNGKHIAARNRRYARDKKRYAAWKRYDDGYGHTDGFFT